MLLPFACTKQPVWCCFLCCPVLSAVLWLLSARSLGPLPSQQHQTKRGLVAVRSLNSKLTSFLFLLFQKLLHLLVTKHRDLPGPVLAANTWHAILYTLYMYTMHRFFKSTIPNPLPPYCASAPAMHLLQGNPSALFKFALPMSNSLLIAAVC